MESELRERAREIVNQRIYEIEANPVAGREIREKIAAPWHYLLALLTQDEGEAVMYAAQAALDYIASEERTGAWLYGSKIKSDAYSAPLYTRPPAAERDHEAMEKLRQDKRAVMPTKDEWGWIYKGTIAADPADAILHPEGDDE